MKKTKIFYWIFTGLFAALMLFSAVPDIMMSKDAVTMMHDQMGYPLYLLPFVGWAKVLGVIAILMPGFPKITEWAYAGLVIDLCGATYSLLALGTPIVQVLPMFLFIAFAFCSYYFYHKKLREKSKLVSYNDRTNVRAINPVTQEA